MATYTMRGQTYELKRPENLEEAGRLQWLADCSKSEYLRREARRFLAMGIEVKVSGVSQSVLQSPETVRFHEISMVARQVLRRRGLLDGDTVTFPVGTQKTVKGLSEPDRELASLTTYVLPDGAMFEYAAHEDGILNFVRK